MSDLIDQARLPKTETAVFIDNFNELIKKAPPADLNIFGLDIKPNFEFMKKMGDRKLFFTILTPGHIF